jgi:hypothetical protein
MMRLGKREREALQRMVTENACRRGGEGPLGLRMLRDTVRDEIATVLLPGQTATGTGMEMMGGSRAGTVDLGVDTSRAGTAEPVSASASVSRAGSEGVVSRGSSEERDVRVGERVGEYVEEHEVVDLTGDDDECDDVVDIKQVSIVNCYLFLQYIY